MTGFSIWKQNDRKLSLILTDTGSHDELFKKKYTFTKK